jgi:hypothetical protein
VARRVTNLEEIAKPPVDSVGEGTDQGKIFVELARDSDVHGSRRVKVQTRNNVESQG